MPIYEMSYNRRHRRDSSPLGEELTAVVDSSSEQISPITIETDSFTKLDLSESSAPSEELSEGVGEQAQSDELTAAAAADLSGGLEDQAQDDDAVAAAAAVAESVQEQDASQAVVEVVNTDVKLEEPASTRPPLLIKRVRPVTNQTAVGEVLVNIQQAKTPPPKKLRHWCDLAGAWVNDEGSLLLTLGFPSSDKTALSGYLSQVSVDMTPRDDGRRRRRRRRRRAGRMPPRRRKAGKASPRRRRRKAGGASPRPRPAGSTSAPATTTEQPHFPAPAAGASGIPASLTNRTALHGSSVTRAGPFALVTRHGGGAVGSMIGQCQTCGNLDTIVAQVYAVSEVFSCIDAMWNFKAVHMMFRKWGERHRRRHHRPQLLETEVVVKQRDRGRQRPPPPPPPQETLKLSEEIVSKYRQR